MNGLLITPSGKIEIIKFEKSKLLNVLESQVGKNASSYIIADRVSMYCKADLQNPNNVHNFYASILAGFSVGGSVFITGFNGDKSLTKFSVRIIAEKIIGITTNEQNKILKEYYDQKNSQ